MKKSIGVISLAIFVTAIMVTGAVASQGDMLEDLKNKSIDHYNKNVREGNSNKSPYKTRVTQGVSENLDREQQIMELKKTREINNTK